jgi:hypothetical protein
MVASHHPSLVNHPPLDGSLFFPELLKFNAQHNPNITFFVYDSPDSETLVSISHLDFYQACHCTAHKIRPSPTGADREVVALIGNSDTLLYHTVFMGIIFAGLIVCVYVLHMNKRSEHYCFKPFPMSPRNSAAAVINMMGRTKCCRVITTHNSLASLIDGIKADFVSDSEGNETAQTAD